MLVGVIYNRAIRLRVLVREGFSGIDVQLKRRHNLIPNLVRTAQAAANFEQNVLTDIARLRTQAMREPDNGNPSIDGKQRDENALTGALVNFFAVAEKKSRFILELAIFLNVSLWKTSVNREFFTSLISSRIICFSCSTCIFISLP